MVSPQVASLDRTGKGLFKRSLKGAQRDAECARMRAAGFLLREIAEHVGLKTEGAVAKAIERALKDVQSPAVEALRAQQQAMIDLAKTAVLGVLERKHLAHSNGKVVTHGCPGLADDGSPRHEGCTWGERYPDGSAKYCDGPPVLDDGPRLQAINALKGLLDRESRLHGIDSPIRTVVEGDELVIRVKGVDTDAV